MKAGDSDWKPGWEQEGPVWLAVLPGPGAGDPGKGLGLNLSFHVLGTGLAGSRGWVSGPRRGLRKAQEM